MTIILIGGIRGSGKTTLAKELVLRMSSRKVCLIDMNAICGKDSPEAFGCEIVKLQNNIRKFKENQIDMIIEGIFALHFAELRELADLMLYVDCDDDLAFGRIIKDATESIENVIQNYQEFVKPASEEYVKPSRNHAHLIIPNNLGTCIKGNEIIDIFATFSPDHKL